MAGNTRRTSAGRIGGVWTASRARVRALTRSLRVELLEDRITPADFTEVEPNNSTAAANIVTVPVGDILTTAPANWLAIHGSVGATGDLDFYRFTLAAASGVFFDVDSRDTGLSTTLDSLVQVFDSAGAAVANGSNNDGYDFESFAAPSTPTFDADSPDSSLYLDLPAGTYFVRVSAFNDATTGKYDLRLLADSNYSKTVPAFNSLPGSADTFFLDFDGHSATDDWGSYTAGPYSLDKTGGTYSPGERLAIRNHWQTAAEDFSPFNINVTTVDPESFADGVAFRTIVTSSPPSIIGETPGVLGIALLNSYVDPTRVNTAFTFAGEHSTYGAGLMGAIVPTSLEMGSTSSHEFGHALGLFHLFGSPGVTESSPIMLAFDNGLHRKVWGSGPAGGIFQDDMAVISGLTNTMGYRPDDHGDTTATATPLTAGAGVYTAGGVIAQLSDVDYFRFGASGNTTIAVDVNTYSGNLDVELRFYDRSGTLFATVDPSNSLSAALSVTLAEGTYFIEVRGDGEVGEAGQYTIRIVTSPDGIPPTTDIAFPLAGVRYGVNEWAGNIAGTAADTGGAGVQRVEVSVRLASTGQYWNGSAFASGTEVFLNATGDTSWSMPFPFANFPGDGSYVIRARAVDFGGNVDPAGPSVTVAISLPVPVPPGGGPAPIPPGTGQPAGPGTGGGNVGRRPDPRPIFAVGTDSGGGPRVRVVDTSSRAVLFDGFVYDPSFRGGVRVATGDVTGDGIPDLVVGAGTGGGPHIQVLDGQTFRVVASFFAYESTFTGGVFVAVGDVNGDGVGEIIVGSGNGGGPLVKVFDGQGRQLTSFFAYEPSFRGGVRAAAADVTGDGLADVITGAGTGGGPLVRVFDAITQNVVAEFFAGDQNTRGGLFVAGGDMDGDGIAEVVAGPDGSGGSAITVRRGRDATLTRIGVFDVGRIDQPGPLPTVSSIALDTTDSLGNDDVGLRVALTDLDASGKKKKILVARGAGYPSRVHSYRLDPIGEVDNFLAFEEGFTSGVFVG